MHELRKSLPESKMFSLYDYQAENLDNINTIKNNVLSLPIHPWLRDEEIDYITDKIKEFFFLTNNGIIF